MTQAELQVKQADAAFFCGTAAEVIGWDSLDDVTFKKEWSDTLSKKIKEAYAAKVIEASYEPQSAQREYAQSALSA